MLKSTHSYLLSENDLNSFLPEINQGLSAIGTSTNQEGKTSEMVKLAKINHKNNKHIQDKIKSERFKVKAERSRIEEKRKYWIE